MRLNIKTPKLKKCSVSGAFKELGRIDKGVDSGKYSQKQHNSMTKDILKKCLGR